MSLGGDQNTDAEEAAARLSRDFKNKECPAFIGCMSRQKKGPMVLGFFDTDVPLTVEGFGDKKQISVGLTIVDCLQEGYTRVPYECQSGDKYKVDKNAQPLSERSKWPDDPDGQLGMLTCYPYGIVEGLPKDKDARNDEYKWEVHPGMVIRASFWSDAARGGDPKKFRKDLCPEGRDVIPAFSLVEVELTMKGWSKWEPGDKREDGKRDREICPVKKGYGMGINGLNVYEGVSLYSVLDKLPKVLLGSLDATKSRQQGHQSRWHSIKDMLPTDKITFYVHEVNPGVSVDLDDSLPNETQIRLGGWALDGAAAGMEASHPIDIPLDVAIAATNCPEPRSACALIELAANAGALSVVVCVNQYRPGKEQARSMLYGFPIIDTKVLLKGVQVPIDPEQLRVDETENYFAFEAGFQAMLPVGVPQKKRRDDDDNDGDGADDEEDGACGRALDEEDEGDESMQTPLLLISKQPFASVQGEHPLKTPDLMLVGNNIDLRRSPQHNGSTCKAYYCRFVHPVLQSRLILWAGYINMAKPQIIMPALGYNILLAAASAAGAGAGGAAAFGAGGGAHSSSGRKRSNARWVDSQSVFDPFATSSSSSLDNHGSSSRGGGGGGGGRGEAGAVSSLPNHKAADGDGLTHSSSSKKKSSSSSSGDGGSTKKKHKSA